jgi:triosephosphate isomerase (TIM)
MNKLIVANWKMAPNSLSEADAILKYIRDFLNPNLIICPPFIFIEEIAKLVGQAMLGAQDIFWDDVGADTGEVSGPMLKKLGVKYIIVGHSERRWKLGESDEVVNKKLKAVLRNEMTPIVCIGEKVRDDSFKDFLKNQISETFKDLVADEVSRCIVAYEPVWAISSNPDAKPDTPSSALESLEVIKECLNSKFEIRNSKLNFLYGGSVNADNVIDFINQEGVDGVLVGGASVNKKEFIKILSLMAR